MKACFDKIKDFKYSNHLLAILSFFAMFVELNKKGIIFNYEWYHYVEMLVWLPLMFWLYLKVFRDNEKQNYISFNILSI